jgi:hypothetical protein
MKTPFWEMVLNLAGRLVVGRTHARHPNVRKAASFQSSSQSVMTPARSAAIRSRPELVCYSFCVIGFTLKFHNKSTSSCSVKLQYNGEAHLLKFSRTQTASPGSKSR